MQTTTAEETKREKIFRLIDSLTVKKNVWEAISEKYGVKQDTVRRDWFLRKALSPEKESDVLDIIQGVIQNQKP